MKYVFSGLGFLILLLMVTGSISTLVDKGHFDISSGTSLFLGLTIVVVHVLIARFSFTKLSGSKAITWPQDRSERPKFAIAFWVAICTFLPISPTTSLAQGHVFEHVLLQAIQFCIYAGLGYLIFVVHGKLKGTRTKEAIQTQAIHTPNERLKQLEQLKAEGLLGDEEYAAKRKEVISSI